jgi:hypothetical protein
MALPRRISVWLMLCTTACVCLASPYTTSIWGKTPPPATASAAAKTPATAAAAPRADDSWHEPETLIKGLGGLAGPGPAAKWAGEVLKQIHALGPAVVSGSNASTTILQRLVALDREVFELAAKTPDKALAHKLRKIGFALGRRIEIWQQVVALGTRRTPDPAAAPDPKRLSECLAKIEAVIGDSPQGQAWRDYLLIDALKQCAARQPSPKDERSREIAQQALIRLTQTPLAPEQQRFVASEPLAALQVELRRWAAEHVSVAALLRDIERYEQTGLPGDGCHLALDCQNLRASPIEAERQLAGRIDTHYRNANCRIAVTEKLINDLIPEQKLEYGRVDERVLGYPVWGESLMATELAVRMLPDPKRARLVLQVTGEIASQTTTDAGAARVHNDSKSYYVARKPLEIDMSGITLYPLEIEVQNDTRLRGLDTSFDAIPIINALAKGVAKTQIEQSKSAAVQEVKQKVAAQARQRIDDETRRQLSGVVDRLNQRVFDPVNSLQLDPQLIDAETTEKRFTMRLRLGGEDQLGGHTPRPQAPSDSLASVQIHESVLNNGIQRLQLAGRTFTLPELSKHVAARLNCPAPWHTNPDNDDVKITFAERDPIVVRFQDGQASLMLSIAQLSKPPRKWNNFRILAFYKPEVHGRSAELVREGHIRLLPLPGRRLPTGYEFALRGIFAGALSKKTPCELIPERLLNEPRLKDTEITQFDINDGWIGLALGPKPPAPMTARRPRWAAP